MNFLLLGFFSIMVPIYLKHCSRLLAVSQLDFQGKLIDIAQLMLLIYIYVYVYFMALHI